MRPGYRLGRWLFLRLLGLVFLVAFVSFWLQVDGLIGSGGILPLGEYLERVHASIGSEAYRQLPTLTWFGHSDIVLHSLCAIGVVLSLSLLAGIAPVPVLLGCWALYLSLQIAGQQFLSFQWDSLLLESGFCALFFAPAGWRPRAPRVGPEPHPAGRWLLWLLLFKLMVLSGAVKLISLDDSWWELTALDYHYFTTCLPLWTGWYAHHLPGGLQKLSVFLMFVAEIGLPFLIFAGRRPRILAAIAMIGFQLSIAATGNYGFFNLLSAVLCVPLLDDAFLERLLPASARPSGDAVVRAGRSRPGRWVPSLLVPVLLLVSSVTFFRELVRTRPPEGIDGFAGTLLGVADRQVVQRGQALLKWTGPFHTINGYGLFRVMTRNRPEIVVEASMDGLEWREYEFRWKPGDPQRRPALVAPHMPRLDWQMWFAALAPERHQWWLQRLVRRLLEGAPAVQGLLGPAPFEEGPPRFVRLVYYEYEFTDRKERDESGAWWRRKRLGYLTRAISLESF